MASKRLLIVEDDPKTLYALTTILSDDGFHVTACADGDCVRRNAAEDFHAALLDVRLPGLSGPEIASELRHKFPALTVIFMTAYNNIQALKAEFPACPVLVKPFDIPTLLQHLR